MQMLLVDTDVVSYFFKKDTRAALYEQHLQDKLLYISFMTRAELERGTIARQWGHRKREQLSLYLRDYAMVVPDEALCRQWAEVYEQVHNAGAHIGVSDAWIAATAMRYGVPLVTHNRKDYSVVKELTVISEAP